MQKPQWERDPGKGVMLGLVGLDCGYCVCAARGEQVGDR